MSRSSKRMQESLKKIDKQRVYTLQEAVELLKACPQPKFDQSVDLAVVLGVDPKKSDQHVRGVVSLPHGTGKSLTIAVIARGEKVQEALAAGAVHVGGDELLEKIAGGWTDFDVLVTTPDMMREVGKLGKVLGPRGLMPSPKGGTVAIDVAKAVTELKGGKVEFKVDRSGVVNNMVGKLSFAGERIIGNVRAFIQAVVRARPAAAKGHFLKSLVISSTMGPGIQIDLRELDVV